MPDPRTGPRTTRILCTIRDDTCRMPGCDRPADDLHLVHKWRWTGTIGAVASGSPLTWTSHGASPDNAGGKTTASTVGRLAKRLPRPPPDPSTLVDQFGDPLPF